MNIEKAKSRIDNQLLKSMYSNVSVDGFHPNVEAHRKWGEELCEFIQKERDGERSFSQ